MCQKKKKKNRSHHDLPCFRARSWTDPSNQTHAAPATTGRRGGSVHATRRAVRSRASRDASRTRGEPTAGSAIRGNMTSHVAPRAISSCLALRGDGNAALAGSFNARAAWASPFHRRAVSRAPSLRRARSVALAAGESAPSGARADSVSSSDSLARRRGASAAGLCRRRRGGGGDARGRDREARRAVLPGRRPRDLGRRLRPTARAFGGAGGGAPGGEAPRQPHGTRRREKRGRRRRFRARKLFGRRRRRRTRVFPRWLARRTSCPCVRCPTCSRTKRRARGSGK